MIELILCLQKQLEWKSLFKYKCSKLDGLQYKNTKQKKKKQNLVPNSLRKRGILLVIFFMLQSVLQNYMIFVKTNRTAIFWRKGM